MVTLGLGLPLAWCLASAIVDLERAGQVKLAALLDAASVSSDRALQNGF